MKVLLLDDSSAIQKVIRLGLGAFADAELKVCETFASANQSFAEFKPDVFIGAQTLGGLDCGKAYLTLPKTCRKILVLADSSEGESYLRAQGYENVLRKPFTLGELRTLIAESDGVPVQNEFGQPSSFEDTAQVQFKPSILVDDIESAFRETVEVFHSFDKNERKNESVDSFPELTINVQDLEMSFQKSLHGEISVPAITANQNKMLDDLAIQNSRVEVSPSRDEELEVQTMRQPDPLKDDFVIEHVVVHSEVQDGSFDAQRPQVRVPSVPKMPAVPVTPPAPKMSAAPPPLPKKESLTRPLESELLIEEYKRVQVERHIESRVSELESRLKNSLRLDLESNFMQSVEGLIRPHVDSYLNKQWPTFVKSVTHQVKKSVEQEYTSKMHSDLIQMQQRLSLDLKAELRNEVQNALRNWMGSYSRDILKEVAREELQRLLDTV